MKEAYRVKSILKQLRDCAEVQYKKDAFVRDRGRQHQQRSNTSSQLLKQCLQAGPIQGLQRRPGQHQKSR